MGEAREGASGGVTGARAGAGAGEEGAGCGGVTGAGAGAEDDDSGPESLAFVRSSWPPPIVELLPLGAYSPKSWFNRSKRT